LAVTSMMLSVPVSNAPLHLAKKVEAALLGQMSEIADQVCDGMLVTGAAVPLKNRDGLGGPRNVVGFIGHALPSAWPLRSEGLLPSRISVSGTRSQSHLCTFTQIRVARSQTTASSSSIYVNSEQCWHFSIREEQSGLARAAIGRSTGSIKWPTSKQASPVSPSEVLRLDIL